MKKVLFIGDTPSKKNITPGLAFLGAACFPTLIEWIKVIQADFYLCLNSSQTEMKLVPKLYEEGFSIIALGKVAAARLDNLGIPYYELPHPSGRTSKLNEGPTIETWLDLARQYVAQKGA